ncbi:MAG TPA: GNAT family protein [Bacteroidia bacterium]|nr:GNAT family protein [Bacteroidia bacterium]
MNLLFGHDQTVADWVSKKWGKSIPPWYFAVGILDNEGVLKGGATFHNYNGSNIELCYYGPKTVTKEIIIGLASFLIDHLKVQRLTVSTPRKNKSMVKNLPRLGFKVEGVLRHYYGPYKRDDAIIFGMLASEGKRFLK